MAHQGHRIFTAANGNWRVGVLASDGQVYITDPDRYASEATATLAAIRAHAAKPFMNYTVVRA